MLPWRFIIPISLCLSRGKAEYPSMMFFSVNQRRYVFQFILYLSRGQAAKYEFLITRAMDKLSFFADSLNFNPSMISASIYKIKFLKHAIYLPLFLFS